MVQRTEIFIVNLVKRYVEVQRTEICCVTSVTTPPKPSQPPFESIN